MVRLDEFELDAPAAPDGVARPRWTPAPRSRWTRRPATWAATAVGLIVLGVIAAPAPAPPVSEVGVPWNVLDVDLASEPEPVWEAPLAVSSLVGAVDDTLVVQAEDSFDQLEPELDQFDRTLIGVDRTTGEQLFTVDDPASTCQLGPHSLTCVEEHGGPQAVVVVRDSEGEVVREVPYPDALSAIEVDGDLVVLEGAGSGLADLVRVDAELVERWRTPMTFSGRLDPSYSELAIVEDRILTRSEGVDLLTGALTGGTDGLLSAQVDGGGHVREQRGDGSTRLMTSDGEEVTIPAGELWLDVDDAFGGSVALRLNIDSTVSAQRRDETGPSWTLTQDECWLSARLQGVLVLSCFDQAGSTAVAFDELTGDRLWHLSRMDVWVSSDTASTDTLLQTSPAGIGGLDPSTGELRWTMPVPGSNVQVAAVGGVILVWSEEILIRLA